MRLEETVVIRGFNVQNAAALYYPQHFHNTTIHIFNMLQGLVGCNQIKTFIFKWQRLSKSINDSFAPAARVIRRNYFLLEIIPFPYLWLNPIHIIPVLQTIKNESATPCSHIQNFSNCMKPIAYTFPSTVIVFIVVKPIAGYLINLFFICKTKILIIVFPDFLL